MQNLEQIRARDALDALTKYPCLKSKKGHSKNDNAGAESGGGDQLTGFPALIVGNGLLAAIAFSLSKGGDHLAICNAIAGHLSKKEVRLLETARDAKSMADELSKGDSAKLRLCTAEALAYLNYLRRFAKASD